jgi:hypothetical protein
MIHWLDHQVVEARRQGVFNESRDADNQRAGRGCVINCCLTVGAWYGYRSIAD